MSNNWLIQPLFDWAGWAYLLATIGAIAAAAFIPSSKSTKTASVILVLGLSSVLPLQVYLGYRGSMAEGAQREAQLKRAMGIYADRCKSAGVRVYSRPERVNALMLEQLRPDVNRYDQYALDDPYGSDFPGEAYAMSFLWARAEWPRLDETATAGARFAYVVYRSATDKNVLLQMTPTSERNTNGTVRFSVNPTNIVPKYTLRFIDMSTKADRDHWIAGSKLQLIESESGSVVAEREGWMIDVGQGDRSGERQPWTYAAATACPPFPKLHETYPYRRGQARRFVDQVFSESEEKK